MTILPASVQRADAAGGECLAAPFRVGGARPGGVRYEAFAEPKASAEGNVCALVAATTTINENTFD